MIAANAFVQTILEQPDADAPRLVFADWLEEQGEPQAELIRVQCECARLANTDPRHDELRAREQELTAAHEAEWSEPLRQLGVGEGRFRRGFREVKVTGVRAYLEVAERLYAFPWVLYAHLGDVAASRDDIAALAASPHFARLQRLDLSRSPVGNDGASLLIHSPYRCQLTHLALNNNQLSSRGLRELVEEFDLRRLTELRLYGNGIGVDGACALSKSPNLSRLRVLDLSFNHLGTDGGEYLAESLSLNHLHVLNVRGNSIGKRGKKALRHRFGPRVQLGSAGTPL